MAKRQRGGLLGKNYERLVAEHALETEGFRDEDPAELRVLQRRQFRSGGVLIPEPDTILATGRSMAYTGDSEHDDGFGVFVCGEEGPSSPETVAAMGAVVDAMKAELVQRRAEQSLQI